MCKLNFIFLLVFNYSPQYLWKKNPLALCYFGQIQSEQLWKKFSHP